MMMRIAHAAPAFYIFAETESYLFHRQCNHTVTFTHTRTHTHTHADKDQMQTTHIQMQTQTQTQSNVQ